MKLLRVKFTVRISEMLSVIRVTSGAGLLLGCWRVLSFRNTLWCVDHRSNEVLDRIEDRALHLCRSHISHLLSIPVACGDVLERHV